MSNLNHALLDQIANLFNKANVKLGVVESCTGGGLGFALTSIAGASTWFEGGLIVYSNRLKMKSVYVRESTLAKHGAVSQECVKEMANAGMVALGVDCCLSVSGIAGPTGATVTNPVGAVWFGLAVRHQSIEAFHRVFEGDREQIRAQAIQEGLIILSKVSLKNTV